MPFALKASLAKDQPRALIQMATGAGKTFTTCTFSWRLLKFAGACRVLLVDRNNSAIRPSEIELQRTRIQSLLLELRLELHLGFGGLRSIC